MREADLLHDPAALAEADRGFLLPAAASAGGQVRAVADQLAGLPTIDRDSAASLDRYNAHGNRDFFY